jgi:Phasin protein
MATQGKASAKSKASATSTVKSAGDEVFANDELEGIEAVVFDEGTAEPSRSEAIADEPRHDTFAGDITDPLAVVVEAAVSPEFEILEELEKEGAKAAETSAGRVFRRWREFANESAACTKEVLDYSYAFGAELLRAKSPAAAAQAQFRFGRSAYLRLLDLTVKVNGIYLNALRQACDLGQIGEAKVKS